VARAEAYPHAKFHVDPSNRLATVHQRHRQTGQDRQRYDSIRANRFTNGRPKTEEVLRTWPVNDRISLSDMFADRFHQNTERSIILPQLARRIEPRIV